MAAQYILAALAIAFLVLAVVKLTREGRKGWIAARTWLIVAVVFGVVSAGLGWARMG